MILTYKIKHNRDFSVELAKAKQVAEFAVEHKTFSSKDVKHIGLKSMIANQILRKYGKNKKIKSVYRVNLIVPSQGVKVDKLLNIPCLDLGLDISYIPKFEKVNQVELNREYAFVSVTVVDDKTLNNTQWFGVDLNTTGHCAVVSNPSTGKIKKFGKQAFHIHKKYKNHRRSLQKKGKYGAVKKIKNRESRIVRNLNHKISSGIVSFAIHNNAGIVLENLKGIRKAKTGRSFRYALNSWSFYQLRQFIEYKAKLRGIPVVTIDPRYTSQQCSRCGLLGERKGKSFKCSCGHVENADVNASFVIALRHIGILQLPTDRDVGKGSTDTPKVATEKNDSNHRTPRL